MRRINPDDVRRAETDAEIATRNGFRLRPTVVPFGTPVIQLGLDNYKASRKAYEELPLIDELVAEINTTIMAEERDDIETSLPDIGMGQDGLFYVYDLGLSLASSEWAHKQLIERTRPYEDNNEAVVKAAAYVSDPECPKHYARDISNDYLQSARDKKGGALTAVLRTRNLVNPDPEDYPPTRELYATVSHRYNTDCDTHELAEMVRRKVNDSGVPAKAEGLYDRRRFKMSVLYHSDIETPIAGELFKAGFTVESADDGSRGVSITPMVMRNLCLNFIILDRSTQRISLTHLRTNLYDSVSEAVDIALSKTREFGERWAAATKEKVLSKFHEHNDPEKVFEQLVKLGHIKLHGIKRDEMVARLLTSWEKEPGYMKTNILNAITRAAHEFSWGTPWIATEMEETAGRLLYNKLNLDY